MAFENIVNLFLQSIIQHCSINQLKSVTFNCLLQFHLINLPINFRNVEEFELNGYYQDEHEPIQLSAQFSESLRYLHALSHYIIKF